MTYEGEISKLVMLSDIKTFEVSHIEENKFAYTSSNIETFEQYREIIDNLLNIVSIYKGKYNYILNEKLQELMRYFELSYLDMENRYLNDNLKRKKLILLTQLLVK